MTASRTWSRVGAMSPDRRVPVVLLGVIVACAAVLHSHHERPMAWTVTVLAVIYVVMVVREVLRHRRFLRSLDQLASEGELGGVAVRWVPGVAPFVAGILRPRIYCDPQIRARLTSGQQRAVVLHERYHQRRRDPLRLLLAGALRPLGHVSRRVAQHLDARDVAREIAADGYAIRNGASRADVAGALVAILAIDGVAVAPGFATALEARVDALLHHGAQPAGMRWARRLLCYKIAAGVVAFCTVVF